MPGGRCQQGLPAARGGTPSGRPLPAEALRPGGRCQRRHSAREAAAHRGTLRAAKKYFLCFKSFTFSENYVILYVQSKNT